MPVKNPSMPQQAFLFQRATSELSVKRRKLLCILKVADGPRSPVWLGFVDSMVCFFFIQTGMNFQGGSGQKFLPTVTKTKDERVFLSTILCLLRSACYIFLNFSFTRAISKMPSEIRRMSDFSAIAFYVLLLLLMYTMLTRCRKWSYVCSFFLCCELWMSTCIPGAEDPEEKTIYGKIPEASEKKWQWKISISICSEMKPGYSKLWEEIRKRSNSEAFFLQILHPVAFMQKIFQRPNIHYPAYRCLRKASQAVMNTIDFCIACSQNLLFRNIQTVNMADPFRSHG